MSDSAEESKKKEEPEWYTTQERCDQCGAQSYYMVIFSFGNLFLCYHHYKKHEERLFEVAEDIVDESELLH
jgi:rRNA maturation protein Nop10